MVRIRVLYLLLVDECLVLFSHRINDFVVAIYDEKFSMQRLDSLYPWWFGKTDAYRWKALLKVEL